MEVRNKVVVELSFDEIVSLCNFLSAVLRDDDCDLAFELLKKLDKKVSED